MAYKVGDRVGDYEVIGILGSGGMGAVYQVRNALSNRVEAMKVLLPDLSSNTDVGDRFLREIRVLGSLEHPNIAALRTAQRVDNQVLMIMECIEGLSLDTLLHRGTIPREHQLSIMAQVLSALDYAHAHGIIHRDIKPSNIMVMPTGQVKLMDFGIAKLAVDRKLTATGSTLGSLYYMSPEQIQGADSVDARSDLYALGVCFYEMTTRKRPFDAPSEYSLMSAHLKENPRPPIELDASIPEPLNQIILMSMAKDPNQRFQSAGAMLSAINSVREQLGFPVTMPGVTRTNPVVAGVATQTAAAGASTPGTVAGSAPIGPAPKSRRGVYMAVGSLVTAGVVVGALMLGPRYFQTGANTTKTGVPARMVEPAPLTPAPAPAASTTTPPANSTVPNTSSSVPGSTAGANTAVPPKAIETAPVTRPGVVTTPANREHPGARAAAVPGPGAAPAPHQAEMQQPASVTPVQQPPSAAANPVQQPPRADNRAAEAQAQANAAALNELREQYNLLAVRAGTTKSGLQSLQNQMGGQGLRADMREAAARMDLLMNEAMASIRSGDTERAKRNMDMADRTIEKLEKFLGR